jgi:two-component system response regulator HydG
MPMPIETWDASTALAATELSPKTEQTYRLVSREGPDPELRHTLGGSEAPRAVAGKGPTCEIRLTDPLVSRRHAVFEATDRGLRVKDLDSTNGTAVNGVRIIEAFVETGDRVRLGDTTLLVEAAGVETIDLDRDDHFGRMLGASDVMRRLYPHCRRLAGSDLSTLIEGETGTGKEVIAEALHEASKRASAPFVVFDCTAVPPNLAESMLFGHEKGSFTGAVASRKGVFEEADGGTLFIDEIGELDYALQPKLLRALERSEVQRVGSNKWAKVDVRILSATRRDLDREVQAGRFRDDLYFRLAVGRIELPPLRARRGDVRMLATRFWTSLGGDAAGPPNDVLDRFEDYSWPGNVRELHHAVARVIALGDFDLNERNMPEGRPRGEGRASVAPNDNVVEEVLAADMPLTRAREVVVADFERRYVERVLARHGGNVVRAAEASGVARRYFQILRARHRGV